MNIGELAKSSDGTRLSLLSLCFCPSFQLPNHQKPPKLLFQAKNQNISSTSKEREENKKKVSKTLSQVVHFRGSTKEKN